MSTPFTLESIPSSNMVVFPQNFSDANMESAISKACTYQVPNYEFTTAGKKGWDGKIKLFKYDWRRKRYTFPVGLLARVVNILNGYGFDDIVYKRHRKSTTNIMDLTWYGPELYPFQQEAINIAMDDFNRGLGSVWCLPTAAGKTITALKLVQELGVPTLVLVHVNNLLTQWIQEIKDQLHVNPSKYHGPVAKRTTGPITVSTYQTIKRDKSIDLKQFDMIICDEAHHVPATTFTNVIERCGDLPYRLGLTATPWREQGDDIKIEAGIGPVREVVTPKELIERGYLAKPNFVFFTPRPMISSGNSWQEEYDGNIVHNDHRNVLIEQAADKLVKSGMQVYIHVQRIDHGKILQHYIPNSKFIYSQTQTKVKNKVIDDFRNGTLKCLISTLLGEGSNFPNIEAIIMASGHKSDTASIQRAGRVLRKGKSGKATIVDFRDSGYFSSQWWQQRLNCYIETYGRELVIGKR